MGVAIFRWRPSLHLGVNDIYIYIYTIIYIGAVILLDRIALEYPQVASQGLIKIPLVSEIGWETMIMMTSFKIYIN